MDSLNVQDLMSSLSKFHNLFDIVRVVDPINKRVSCYDFDINNSYGFTCYEFWATGTQCSNCISLKAMEQNDTFIKIEYKEDQIFMIVASPVKLGDKEYVVEMLKNITLTEFIHEVNSKGTNEANTIIQELNQKIITDELACVYNRRYINRRLPADIHDATLNNRKLSVIMLDIDYFKQVNDTYGHVAGDIVIKELCAIMKSKIRKNYDWVARYGGEEFIVVLLDANQQVTYRIAEEIRVELQNKLIKYKENIIQITASIGTYTVEPGTKSFNEVIHIVDDNLYQAKNKGRNRTVST